MDFFLKLRVFKNKFHNNYKYNHYIFYIKICITFDSLHSLYINNYSNKFFLSKKKTKNNKWGGDEF
jgi:hypothetical protein